MAHTAHQRSINPSRLSSTQGHTDGSKGAGVPRGTPCAFANWQKLFLFCLTALLTVLPASMHAQTFQTLPALSFTKLYQGNNPPSQVITATSTGAGFNFNYATVNSTGGNWLSISPNYGTSSTPRSIIVSANPDIALAPGTYSAQITLTSSDGQHALVIPVSLVVAQPSAPSFDETAGALTFSLITKGSAPPLQTVPIRNAGSGTLNWTATASTADGGSWLTLSATSGTTPSSLQVGINPANLPSSALSAGVFVGQVVLQTDGDRTTIPVTVTVGDSVFRQINPLSFTKAYQGNDPPSQVITAASTGASFNFNYYTVNSTGGSWLSISPNYGASSTPRSIIVSANPAVTLAAGTYTAEIVLTSTDGTQASVIPVSLTIAPPTAAFFDETNGALTFSMQTSGVAPTAQAIPISNAGSGTLNWTASASTADGGNWLTLSSRSGTAPSTLSVTVDPTYLPGQGLTAGVFTGQIVLQSSSSSITVPVTFTIGSAVFTQLTALSFSKPFQGANPTSQTITAASTGASFNFNYYTVNSTGGSWLSISPNYGASSTPRIITVSATPAANLNPGTYTAEIILTDTDGTQACVIPVFLTVVPTPQPAATPTFSPATGTYTATQTVTIADTTPGATIYYTINGSTPTTSSAVYSSPIAVNANETLKAVAISSSTTLSGTATAVYTFAPATINASSVSFGSQAISAPSAAQTVIIANPGANALAGVSLSLSGTNPADFALTANGCSAGIAAGGTCSFSIVFTPQGSKGRSAIVSIAYTGVGSPLSVGLSGTGVAGALQFVPVTPCRIADTRNATGAFGGPIIAAGVAREFDIPQSSCGIPATALAYSLNVTVVPPGPLGFLTLWPTGLAQPNSSTLNSDGRVKANAAITPAGDRGGVNIYVSSASHVILDINGYFVAAGTASALAFYPVTPCRIADTRNATGPLGAPSIDAQGSRTFPVQSSSCGIPATAQAYSLNVTAVPKGKILNYITTWPTGQSQPKVSTLNASTGAVTANAAIVPAGTNGNVSFYASDATDLVLDINGYFAPPASGGLSLYTVNPCRVIDTRSSSGLFNGALTIPVATSACAPPANAAAYVLNATVVPPGPIGYLSLWPDSQSQPQVSTLNANDGVITSNLAIVPVVNGKVDAYTSSPNQLILDISSYFAP